MSDDAVGRFLGDVVDRLTAQTAADKEKIAELRDA
ncbi:hypothetical protein LCGC14_2919970, partial [marine sediment metagenome]